MSTTITHNKLTITAKKCSLMLSLILTLGLAFSVGGQDNPPLMRFTGEAWASMIAGIRAAPPSVAVPGESYPSSLSLLARLPHDVPAERNQRGCGNCWQWAATGAMEIARDVQTGTRERLSVQLINSCNPFKNCCEGGSLEEFALFYAWKGFAIPWANQNAQFLSVKGNCNSAPCGSICTERQFPIKHIIPVTIPTWDIGKTLAIANIKHALTQNKAVVFSFQMGTSEDWRRFGTFWSSNSEETVWSDFFTGQFPQPDGRSGHVVLCVGYNEENPANRYWIMVNSWGTNTFRPNGTFRVSMDIDYNTADTSKVPQLAWQTMDIEFAPFADGTPSLAAEPAITPGTQNTIYWTPGISKAAAASATIPTQTKSLNSGSAGANAKALIDTRPDITPEMRPLWADKIPVGVSQLQGDLLHNYSGPYYDSQMLYFNWAAYNWCNPFNLQSHTFNVHCEVTGDGGGSWTWNVTTLPLGTAFMPNDVPVGPLAKGNHTFKVWVDSDNNVDEVKEGNNYYERTIDVKATEFYAECACNPDFTNALSSGWTTEKQWTFSSLKQGEIYFYRVMARRNGQETDWSNVTCSRQGYTLSLAASPSKEGSVSGGGLSPGAETRTVKAKADSCCRFVNWTENGVVVSTSSNYTFTVNADRSLVANFGPIKYIISRNLADGGSSSGGGAVACGATATVCAFPDACHTFAGWYENRVLVSSSTCYSFVAAADRSLTPSFHVISYTISTSVQPAGSGDVTGGSSASCGSLVSLHAVARPNYRFSGWSDNGAMVSFSPSYQFSATANRSLVANFYLDPYVPVSGTYRGLFYETNGVAQHSSGYFTLSSRTNRTFTGALQLGAPVYPFHGQFDTNGAAHVIVNRTNLPALTLDLQVDSYWPNTYIGGTVSDGVWTANLSGDRAVFNTQTNPAPQAGKYTLVIPGHPGDTNRPAGYSYAAVSVSAGGSIHFAGSLADGTAFSRDTVVAQNGMVPLYVPLYRGNGSLLSWIQFTGAPSAPISSDISWIKPAISNAAYYPMGFTNLDTLTGSSYTPNTNRVLNLTEVQVTFAGADLSSPFANRAALNANNHFVNESANSMRLSVTVSNGIFSGAVTVPGTTHTNAFKGAFLQPQEVGYGYFLSGHMSGRVLITPVP